MTRRFVCSLPVLAIAVVSSSVSAQKPFPPEKTENLQVLPKDMPVRAVIDTMRSFTNALGVRCTYCHVGNEGEPIDTYNFVSDDKDTKKKARVMLQMVAAINNDHLSKLVDRKSPPISVSCITCHRGVAEPRPLSQVVLNAYEVGGADSAEKVYRSLRTRYLGRAAYDFSETSLAEVGAVLRAKNKTPDALRFYLLNTEVNATGGAYQQLAGAQLAAGDTSAAVASLEKAAALNPNDQRVKQMLERFKKNE